MIEKFKKFFTKSFSNSPKAKTILALTLTVMLSATVIVSMRKTVTVSIDGEVQTFVTYKGTVNGVLQSAGITVDEKDIVQPILNNNVPDNGTIIVKKAKPVTIVTANNTIDIKTAETTVKDVLTAEKETLKKAGFEYVQGTDEVSIPLDTKVSRDMEIKLVKVEFEDVSETQTIAFETITEKDSSLASGSTRIKQEGSNGEEEVIYRITKKDGVEVSKEVVQSTVTVKPVSAIKVVGTSTGGVLNRGNSSINYKKVLTMKSTAYSPQCVGGNKTATGTYPRRDPNGISTIAVDPRVIPLGSLVYIDGYGYARAEDTGGAIKGNIIDVFVGSHSEALSWGRRTVTVYIVE